MVPDSFLWIGLYIIIDITLNAEVGTDVERPLWFIHHEWDRYWETGLDQEQNNGRQQVPVLSQVKV